MIPESPTSLVPPIVLVDGHDVMICANVTIAERFLEPWAVEDGSSCGFDAVGRRLAFRVKLTRRAGWFDKMRGPVKSVTIDAAEREPTGRADLKLRLLGTSRLLSPRNQSVTCPYLS